jgi:acyl carrier protein
MKREDIASMLLTTIKENYNLELVDVKEEHGLDDLGLDSLDRIGLWLSLEDTFKIDISEDEIRKCSTVGELLDLLTVHLKNK